MDNGMVEIKSNDDNNSYRHNNNIIFLAHF